MSNTKTSINTLQVQTCRLAPQYLQIVKLLQVRGDLLNEYIDKEVSENPVLEYDDGEINVTVNEKNDEYVSNNIPVSREYSDWKEESMTYDKTLTDYLYSQFASLDLSDKEYVVAKHLVLCLDKDGYFRMNIDTVVNDILLNYDTAVGRRYILNVLKKIQKLDPPGVGARSLQECLLLQLSRSGKDSEYSVAINIVSNFFNDFKKRHFAKIKERLNVNSDVLDKAINLVVSCDPFPCKNFLEDKNKSKTIPDFTVIENGGRLSAMVNLLYSKKIKINTKYVDIVNKGRANGSDKFYDFAKKKIDDACSFINAIEQRKITLTKTIQTILRLQYDYFLHGGDPKFLKPMILKDVAECVNVDTSTMSRISSNKTIQTNFGVISMKSLFSEAISTDSGEQVSNKAVKDIIKTIIEQEDKKKPLSDEEITKTLNRRGYNVARRTVAKYRQQLRIPVCRLRKNNI